MSNVINGKALHTEETRRRVAEAIEALGYRPNRAARSLRSRRTLQLAYHVPQQDLDPFGHPFAIGFLQELIRAADAKNYHILTFTCRKDDLSPFEDLIAMQAADGFILSNSAINDRRAELLAAHQVAYACMGRLAPHLPQAWVDVDNADGVARMVDYLAHAGRTDFAYVGHSGSNYWDLEREKGFRAGLSRNGLSSKSTPIVRVETNTVHSAVSQLLHDATRHPRTIVAGSDMIATVTVNAAIASALVPGRDVIITGFGGAWLHTLFTPQLATVRLPWPAIATALVERCLAEYESGPTDNPGVVLPTEIWHASPNTRRPHTGNPGP